MPKHANIPELVTGLCEPIAQELGVPVKFVGLGEGIDDLQPFNAEEYVKALI